MKSLLSLLFFSGLFFLHSQNNSSLFNYQKNAKNLAITVQKQQLDSVTVFEKVIIDGFDSKVPFYHFVNSRKKIPSYVILMHGLSDSKEDWVYPSEPYLDWGRNLTRIKDSLITLGYSLIIPDAKFHGERSYELNFRPPESLPPVISRNQEDTELFETLMTSTVKDLRIIMDHVQQLHSQDLTFSTIGYSMGGNLSILLSVFDNRITHVVACVPPLNLPARGLEAFKWPDNVIQGQLDITPMTYAKYQNAPILLLMGKKDFYTTEAEVSQFMGGVPIYDKRVKFFNSGHILPNIYRHDAINWIMRYDTK